MWAARDLFYFLVWRDIKVRYAQTALGAFWTLFQPLGMMLVFTYAFARLADIDTGTVPYPVFALSGLALWLFISRAVMLGASSLVSNVPLVTKTSCPRIVIVLASIVPPLLDFVISISLFLLVAGLYGIFPSWKFVLVPPILLLAFLLALGLSLFLAALNVRYRDVGQALPFIVQLWFFLSPVAYTLHTPGLSWATIVQAVNPLVGMIGVLRWALVDEPAPRGLLLVSVVATFLLLVGSIVYFVRAERTLADDA
ncbi:MAG: ABC transporter permease [Actinobacteria bacterium]|nr:ABC transporter permease [Actinomycetota bacterium]